MNTGDWTAVAAIATGAMAVATFMLALKTRSMSKATEKMAAETKAMSEATLNEAKAVEQQTQHIQAQVTVSSDALRASVQPWLTWVTILEEPTVTLSGWKWQKGFHPRRALDIAEQGDDIAGHIVVRNVGTGIALLNLDQSCLFNANNSEIPLKGIRPSMRSPIVPLGEHATVEIKIQGTKGSNGTKVPLVELVGGGGSETMYTELAYSDVLGAITARAKFQACRKMLPNGTPERWHVIKTIYHQNGREPITVRSV